MRLKRGSSFLGIGVIGFLLLSACQLVTAPDPPTYELLLPITQVPPSWELVAPPRPMGASIGFGDEDDYYSSFKLNGSKYTISDHFVLYYSREAKAKSGYDRMFRSRFNSNSVAVDEPWQTPRELAYSSTYADQFYVACTINNVAGRKQVCQMMGRYGKYVTIYTSTVEPDTMSLSEFNEIVRYLDELFVSKLG